MTLDQLLDIEHTLTHTSRDGMSLIVRDTSRSLGEALVFRGFAGDVQTQLLSRDVRDYFHTYSQYTKTPFDALVVIL